MLMALDIVFRLVMHQTRSRFLIYIFNYLNTKLYLNYVYLDHLVLTWHYTNFEKLLRCISGLCAFPWKHVFVFLKLLSLINSFMIILHSFMVNISTLCAHLLQCFSHFDCNFTYIIFPNFPQLLQSLNPNCFIFFPQCQRDPLRFSPPLGFPLIIFFVRQTCIIFLNIINYLGY